MSSSRSEVWDVPEWLVLGESVHIRLTSSTGVVAYLGPAHFAPGTWVGVELDTPTGEAISPSLTPTMKATDVTGVCYIAFDDTIINF